MRFLLAPKDIRNSDLSRPPGKKYVKSDSTALGGRSMRRRARFGDAGRSERYI